MRKISILILVAAAALIGGVATVRAATAPAPAQQGGQGLEISPPLLETQVNPGETKTLSIRIRNVTKGELVVNGKADDFGAKGEEGQPQILLDEKEATRYSLKYWVTNVPSFRLVPQEVKTAQITVAVPANAEPGGHYGVIRFTGVPAELEGTGVSLSASIGSLILMRVSGPVSEKLSVAEFGTSAHGKKGSFFEKGPINLFERLRNDGSVHVKPVGYVKVYNWYGRKVAEVPISNPARNVLPDSIRKFEQTLNKKFLFGRYTAQFSAIYGQKNQTLTSKKLAFWVIPYKLIILVLLGLLLIFLILRTAIRRYNRYILNQANKR